MIFDWGKLDEHHGLIEFPRLLFMQCVLVFQYANNEPRYSRIQIPKTHAVTPYSALIPDFWLSLLLLVRQPPKSLGLKKQNGAMSQIKVDEVLRFCSLSAF